MWVKSVGTSMNLSVLLYHQDEAAEAAILENCVSNLYTSHKPRLSPELTVFLWPLSGGKPESSQVHFMVTGADGAPSHLTTSFVKDEKKALRAYYVNIHSNKDVIKMMSQLTTSINVGKQSIVQALDAFLAYEDLWKKDKEEVRVERIWWTALCSSLSTIYLTLQQSIAWFAWSFFLMFFFFFFWSKIALTKFTRRKSMQLDC